MIDCVSIPTCHHFPGNPVVQQHQLRYREVIQKEEWENIYILGEMEFDQYDNIATEYYIARNENGMVAGVTRSYPTTLPYMLSESFPHLFTKSLPSSPQIFEASRLVLDRTLLTKEQRQPIINQLILAYMERGLQRGIDAYVGFMLPKIWASTFLRVGWDVEWLGPEAPLAGTGDTIRAALMPVNKELEEKIRGRTGLYNPVLNFGSGSAADLPGLAQYSHTIEKRKLRVA